MENSKVDIKVLSYFENLLEVQLRETSLLIAAQHPTTNIVAADNSFLFYLRVGNLYRAHMEWKQKNHLSRRPANITGKAVLGQDRTIPLSI